MLKGRVYKSTGSWYLLKDEQGQFLNARLAGKMKLDEDIRSTNPIAVGDMVEYITEEKEGSAQAVIKNISERRNYIVRVAPQNRHRKHVLAANLDQAVVMATVSHPRTSTGFIDRFLVTAEAYHIPAIILVNKTDLLKAKEERILAQWINMYTSVGYLIYTISALSPLPEKVKRLFHQKTTLVCGHSGVGKSTFLNQLLPELELKTEIISAYSGKGQHTTTFATMFDLPDGEGCVIDTPGVKEMGIIDISVEELSHYFPEMRALIQQCKFNNCTHENEPNCAVKEAVNKGMIDEERYINYLRIAEQLKEAL